MPGVRCSQRSDLSAQRPPSRPQAGRGRRWSDGDHLGRPFLRRLFVITELGQILPLADLPSTTDVPPSGRTTRPVVYAQPDHACPPGQARVSLQRHSVNVSTITENLRQAVHAAVQHIAGCQAASSECSPTGNLAPQRSATPWP